MKDKFSVITKNIKASAVLKFVFSILFGITAVVTLFYLFDKFFNGVFVDWFDSAFVFYYGDMASLISYDDLKQFVLKFLIVIIVVIITAVYIAVYITKRRTRKQAASELSRMIHTYMTQETDIFSVFPDSFLSVSAEMAEIKADITRKEQMLREEAVRKNDLIAYLAHDLKTPLTSVIGYLSLMDESPELPTHLRAKYINISLDKAQRLEEMINSFFDIARYNLQQTVIEKEKIDLQYMMMQIIEEFYPLLKSHGNTVSLDITDGITVLADGNELARVFNNILKNAIAYSYSDTPIVISAKNSSDSIRIIIQNNGRTIPQAKLDSIFDKFFRLDSARSSNSGGAGLGLAIAKEIITLHGGSINAQSADECTVFEVILPN